MAMRDEAAPIIASLKLRENPSALNPRLPMRCFQDRIERIEFSLVLAGVDERHSVDHIGSEAATLMAYESITRLRPDLLISAGTAGGFAALGAEIGTVYVSDGHFVYHDRHVPLPGFEESALGRYPALAVGRLARDLGLTTGVISTGSSLAKSDRDLAVLARHNAVAKEMEAASIAWVAMLLGVPMMALKSITNLVDEDNASETEFVRNFGVASQRLHDKVIDLVDYLQGKDIDALG